MNRLASEQSPYLLQHKDNPVEWWPWSAAAFAEARRLNKPVLLSVGYAACHWCHVMAHESFEDPATARLMNELFVNVKVDREERPDVDAVYMAAVQALTGQGGWPMTVFLTPDGGPFFAGTYFPPADRLGMPAFRRVLTAVAEAWRERGERVRATAAELTSQLAAADQLPAAGEQLRPELLDRAAARLLADRDPVHGGFHGAPKFPPSLCLEFLLRHHARTGSAAARQFVELTAERMARGGIYDQLAGGFARYSVDGRWVVPHFEKMLYDNAQLLRVYAHLWRATGSPLARRVAVQTADWLVADLGTPEGGFASALDADSEGEEGRYYLWTPRELRRVLGADAPAAAGWFAVTSEGTFEHGRSVLQLPVDPPDAGRFADVRDRLLAARRRRVPPARDDKVVTAWNGLAVAGLADAAVLFDRADLLTAAQAAAGLLAERHLVAGRLRRTSRGGRPGPAAGVLEDHADFAEGLLALHQADADDRWLALAERLLDTALARFADGAGGFYDTADDAERLVHRPRDPTDNVTPAGGSGLAGALLTCAALTGEAGKRTAAWAALGWLSPLVERAPRFAGWAAAAAEAALAGPLEIAVLGRPDLAEVARRTTSPGAVVVTGGSSPLVAGRPAGAAYVCRGFACRAPIRDPAELARELGCPPSVSM